MLYRVFPLLRGTAATEEGGALYVPRHRQGEGRHDNPDRYGALYASRAPGSAVAERIQAFRGRVLADRHFQRENGGRLALAALDDASVGRVTDLDDPAELVRRDFRPSAVATRRRDVTRSMALRMFDEGLAGFGWWSTLEASWANVTLFAERATPRLRVEGDPEPLTVDHPAVWAAADMLGIRLG
ncbi:MAG: RES family NAD+ phosphorylase [Actinomycetota bacterium]|nr:RES family NAD+ phosphorylase [Actinomycetota bacterium]